MQDLYGVHAGMHHLHDLLISVIFYDYHDMMTSVKAEYLVCNMHELYDVIDTHDLHDLDELCIYMMCKCI